MNIHQLLAIGRQRQPEKVAIEYRDPVNPSVWTYSQLYEAADRLAVGLRNWGLRKGDRVAFYLESCPEFVLAYLAVIRLGAVVVPINLRYRRLEIGHIVNDCSPRLIISQRSQGEILADAGVLAGSIEDVLWVEDLDSWMYDENLAPADPVKAEDLALIIYTSGTTGQSKGAMLTHSNMVATITALTAAWAWERNDVLLLCLPLFHTHGLTVGLHCALANGATVRLHRNFDAQAIVDDLLDKRTTLFFAVPTVYVRLIAGLRGRNEVDLAHMRLFCSGSAPLAPETFVAFRELTGHTILERYGMTETGMNLSNLYAGPRVAGSVGVPLPGVSMRIVGEQGKDVQPGQEGELLLRGGNVFSGYWNAPDKTDESFSHDAQGHRWFHTGDLAREDPQTGYVSLLGRRHELIISGGFNIYPREIEEMLLGFPGVAEVAVVGRPHAEWGEIPVAYLVCEQDVSDDRLVLFCREQLASYKVPQQFYRVTTLPRNAMGKLQKHLIE